MKSLVAFLLGFAICLQQTTAQSTVPIFNSDATATSVLFLDFDGHIMSGTSWNVNGPINLGPANLNPQQITEVYNRIAEDYRPFSINVTTDSTKYEAASTTKRMRLLFTITSSWYGNGAGGVAYIGSFTWGDNTPCFVFTALLGYNTKYISEAGAHEAGHTLGLRHQSSYDQNCVKTNEYNYGTGDGATSWAPIMGVGYYRNSTTWHNGPNPYGCTNTQQDLDVITQRIPYKTDDYDETFRRAENLRFVNNNLRVAGTVNLPTDKDMFELSFSGRKRLMLDVVPTNAGQTDVGANLDVQVQLYNSSRSLIATINPANALSATADTVLEGGTYYALVDGVGNNFTPNDYGSLGNYSLQAQLADVTPLPLHKLELKGAASGGTHTLNWIIEADEAVLSQTVEASVNGSAYATIANPGAAARSFNRSAEGLVLYRLLVKFDNGRSYYSNSIALRSATLNRPKLLTTRVDQSLQINSPLPFEYSITDYSGRTLASGRVSGGSTHVALPSLKAGAYLIRFTNNAETYVDKFVKQ